jgi:hypothetical protein
MWKRGEAIYMTENNVKVKTCSLGGKDHQYVDDPTIMAAPDGAKYTCSNCHHRKNGKCTKSTFEDLHFDVPERNIPCHSHPFVFESSKERFKVRVLSRTPEQFVREDIKRGIGQEDFNEKMKFKEMPNCKYAADIKAVLMARQPDYDTRHVHYAGDTKEVTIIKRLKDISDLMSKILGMYAKAEAEAKGGDNTAAGVEYGDDDGDINRMAFALASIKQHCTILRDQRNEVYAVIRYDDHDETLNVASEAFKSWITNEIYKELGEAMGRDDFTALIRILSHHVKDKPPVHLELRTNIERNGDSITIWYDMANEKWQAVKITADPDGHGWEVVNKPPPLFRRYAMMRPQVMPASHDEGDINLLDKYFLIKPPIVDDIWEELDVVGKSKEEQDRIVKKAQKRYITDMKLLMKTFVVFQFLPSTAFFKLDRPPLVLTGDHGAAKTTTAEVIKTISDPSTTPVMQMPDDPDRMQLQLEENYLPVYDNLGGLRRWQSDTLCRAATGDGAQKRKNYTDMDMVAFSYYRTVIMTALDAVAAMPDMVDRSITIEIERMKNGTRRDKDEYWASFNRELAPILSGAFTTLSKALYLRNILAVGNLERMTGFYIWGSCIAEAIDPASPEPGRFMGYPVDEHGLVIPFSIGGMKRFQAAYSNVIGSQNETLISRDAFAEAICRYMDFHKDYHGYTSGFFEQIELELPSMGYKLTTDRHNNIVISKPEGWPKGHAAFGRALRKLKVVLERAGITITFGEHTMHGTPIHVIKADVKAEDSSKDAKNATA